jgi:hypothetical protein
MIRLKGVDLEFKKMDVGYISMDEYGNNKRVLSGLIEGQPVYPGSAAGDEITDVIEFIGSYINSKGYVYNDDGYAMDDIHDTLDLDLDVLEDIIFLSAVLNYGNANDERLISHNAFMHLLQLEETIVVTGYRDIIKNMIIIGQHIGGPEGYKMISATKYLTQPEMIETITEYAKIMKGEN